MSRVTFGYVQSGVDALSAFRFAVMAERHGFDAVWLGDHFLDVDGDKLEPWTVMSAVAPLTKRARLGSDVTDCQRNHPARTAQMVASLDTISRGRAILGIGAGEAMNIVPFGLPWETPTDRIARLEETIEVILALWASSREKTITFSGRFYSLKDAFLSQSPKQKPHPPIYVGAFSSESALKLVGRRADGWISWFNTADTYKKRWSIILREAASIGRSFKEIEPVTHLLTAFPRNSSEKRTVLLAGKAVLLMEKHVLRSLKKDFDPRFLQYQNLLVSKDYVERIMAAAESIPDDLVYKTMGIGGTGEVIERIDELTKAGAKHIILADLLAPKTAKRTLRVFSRIIRTYK